MGTHQGLRQTNKMVFNTHVSAIILNLYRPMHVKFVL